MFVIPVMLLGMLCITMDDGLAYRARTVVNERDNRRKELEHLRGAMKCSGYPGWILCDLRDDSSKEKEVKRPEVKATTYKERNKKLPVGIPYIKLFGEQTRRVLGKYMYGIPTYFKLTSMLQQLLVKPKDPVSKENMVG